MQYTVTVIKPTTNDRNSHDFCCVRRGTYVTHSSNNATADSRLRPSKT